MCIQSPPTRGFIELFTRCTDPDIPSSQANARTPPFAEKQFPEEPPVCCLRPCNDKKDGLQVSVFTRCTVPAMRKRPFGARRSLVLIVMIVGERVGSGLGSNSVPTTAADRKDLARHLYTRCTDRLSPRAVCGTSWMRRRQGRAALMLG